MLAICAVVPTALAIAACRVGASAPEGLDWPTYNRTPDGQRYAALDEINTRNVSQLKRVCELTLGEEGPFQAGPVVVGDRMFVTTGHTTVAMNATNCFVYWRHVDSSGQSDPISVNRRR
jgi:alcohol dehydrogenase (cytochrome c)